MGEEERAPKLVPPIPDELIAAIEAEIGNTYVSSKTTDLEAGFMLGIQHALAALKRHKNGGVI